MSLLRRRNHGQRNWSPTQMEAWERNGLVLHEVCDGQAPIRTIDHSGSGNHGVAYGGVSSALGREGIRNAFSFDGTDDWINYPVIQPASFTAATWFRAPTSGTWMRMLNCRIAWSLDIWATGQMATFTSTIAFTGTGSIYSPQIVTDGQWHHGCFTYDGTTHTQYLDGVFNGSVVDNGPIIYFGISFALGRNGNNDEDYFKGEMDDSRLYDRALSAAEVASLASPSRRIISTGIRRRTVSAAGTYTASVAATAGSALSVIAAAFTAPTFTSSIEAILGGALSVLAATHTPPTYTAAVDSIFGGSAAVVAATHTPPTYTAAVDLILGGTAAVVAATFDSGTFTASVTAILGGSSAIVSATSTTPIFTASLTSFTAGPATSITAVPAAIVLSKVTVTESGQARIEESGVLYLLERGGLAVRETEG